MRAAKPVIVTTAPNVSLPQEFLVPAVEVLTEQGEGGGSLGFPLMHVKDMIKQPDGKELMTVLGKGSLDYGPIMHAATQLQYYFVEQESFEMEPIEELRLNAEYMHKLNG